MEKMLVGLSSSIILEVRKNYKSNSENFKQAIENGEVEILKMDVNLVDGYGRAFEDPATIETIKQAIIYGLKEKA